MGGRCETEVPPGVYELSLAVEAAVERVAERWARGEFSTKEDPRADQGLQRWLGDAGTTPAAVPVAQDADWFGIAQGGESGDTFVVTDLRGRRLTILAVPGKVYRMPFRLLEYSTGATVGGLRRDVEILAGPMFMAPDSLAPMDESAWELVEYVDTGAGNGNTDVEVDAGYEYELCALSVRVVNDATVANRREQVSVRRADGATQSHIVRHPDDTAASETAYHLFGPGFPAAARTLSTDSWAWDALAWCGRVPSTQTNLALVRVTVAAGVAGDVVTVVSSWRRRRIDL